MKFLIFDDHKIFAKSFKLLLNEKGFENVTVCDTAGSVQDQIDIGEELIIFSDYLMPDLDILELVKKWKQNKHVSIVVISSITSAYMIANLLRNKADGFVSKSAEPEEISNCIKEVLHGNTYISKEFQKEVMNVLINSDNFLFSRREMEIIQLIKEGKTIKDKARILYLSENTIITHRRNIMHKAGVRSVNELLIKIYEML